MLLRLGPSKRKIMWSLKEEITSEVKKVDYF